jgi:HK97 family phage prohead protease
MKIKKEKRSLSFTNLSIRSSDTEGKRTIEGIIPYNSKSVPIWGTIEIIDETAFNKTLSDKSEVRALWNHNDSYILGSTKSGTLELENTDDGLICRCELPNTSYANDLYEIVNRGDVRTMSFGFMPIKWEDSNNGKLRVLKEVKLEEVSFGVVFPAYPETDSQTYLRRIHIMKKRSIDIESIAEILEKEELTEEEITQLKDMVVSINEIISENSKEETEEKAAGEEEQREEITPQKDATAKPEEDPDELELIQTAIELEILDLDEIKEQVEEKESEQEKKDDKNE